MARGGRRPNQTKTLPAKLNTNELNNNEDPKIRIALIISIDEQLLGFHRTVAFHRNGCDYEIEVEEEAPVENGKIVHDGNVEVMIAVKPSDEKWRKEKATFYYVGDRKYIFHTSGKAISVPVAITEGGPNPPDIPYAMDNTRWTLKDEDSIVLTTHNKPSDIDDREMKIYIEALEFAKKEQTPVATHNTVTTTTTQSRKPGHRQHRKLLQTNLYRGGWKTLK